MNRENLEKEIREDWFKDHVAEFTKLNDRVTTLSWGNPGSSCYYIRYVFDGCKLYISGDAGEAVFSLTEKSDLESMQRYDVHYLHGKLSAFCEDKYSFDSVTAIARIKEAIAEATEEMEELDDSRSDIERKNEITEYVAVLYDLINESDSCFNVGAWKYEVNKKYDDLTDYDSDVAEWIFNAGNVIPSRVQGYLIGLKMAYEQLNSK